MNHLEALKPGGKIRESLAASCPKLETYRTLMAGKSFAKATAFTDEDWRLCRSGSKWNPLRSRVDTIPENDDFPPVVAGAVIVPTGKTDDQVTEQKLGVHSQLRHLDRVFVATFLGIATGLCLLPTTLAFYATFSMIYIGLVKIEYRFFLPDNLVVTAPVLDSVRVPFLSLELTRDSLQDVLKRSAVFNTKNLFGRRCSPWKVLHDLICARLLYPLSQEE
uniref:Uncharacterized protein n=1 Tax=Mesocestoides corti TaxID=53468 RepID=A0A5K3FRQ0_MESCO